MVKGLIAAGLVLLGVIGCNAAYGDVYVRTNTISPLSPALDPLNVGVGDEVRITLYSRASVGVAYNLTNTFVRGVIVSALDPWYTNRVVSGTIYDATNGHCTVRFIPTNSAANLQLSINAYQTDNSNFQARLSWHNLVFTNGDCATCVNIINVTNATYNLGGVTNLADIDDVTATAPNASDVLIWNGSSWTSATWVSTGQVNGITVGGASNYQGRFDLAAGSGITLTPNATGVTIAATSGSGSETRSFYWSVGWNVNDYNGFASATWYPIQPTNTPACVYYVTNTYTLFNVTNFTFSCATTGVHTLKGWLEEAGGIGKAWVLGIYENDILITNGIGNLYAPSTTADFLKGIIGYCGDESALTGTSFNDAAAEGQFYCGNITNVYKAAFGQIAGSVASLWRGRLSCWWEGGM